MRLKLPFALLAAAVVFSGCSKKGSPPPAPAAQSAVNPAPVNPAPPPPATSPAPAPVPPFHPAFHPADSRTIPRGTTISVRTSEPISSETAAPGQTYPGVLTRAVKDTAGGVAIPRGAKVALVVRAAAGQGKVEGRSELALSVASVAADGRTYRLETNDVVRQGTEGIGANKRTGEFLGGGSAVGGIIGALAGGGKAAVIGALSGAAAGTATQAATRGPAVRIAAETVLNFRLKAAMRIPEIQ